MHDIDASTATLLHAAVQHLLSVETGLRDAVAALHRAELTAERRDKDLIIGVALAHLKRAQQDYDVIRENVEVAELRIAHDEGLL